MTRSGGMVSVRVEGLTSLFNSLIALGLDVDDPKDAMASIAEEGRKIAAAHAPVLTGRLRDDIRGNRAKSKAVITSGRVSVPYAGAINYGWEKRHIAASGYMQEIDKELGPKAVDLLQRSINELIVRHGLG